MFIARYDNQDSAIEKINKVKTEVFPMEMFFKQLKGSDWGVYVGPFKAKEPAEKLLKKLKEKPDFSGAKLEKL